MGEHQEVLNLPVTVYFLGHGVCWSCCAFGLKWTSVERESTGDIDRRT